MAQVSLAEAKAKLSALVEQVLDGEEVEITRRGRPVVRLVASEKPRPRIDVDAMRRLTESQRRDGLPLLDSDEFWRAFREDTRY